MALFFLKRQNRLELESYEKAAYDDHGQECKSDSAARAADIPIQPGAWGSIFFNVAESVAARVEGIGAAHHFIAIRKSIAIRIGFIRVGMVGVYFGAVGEAVSVAVFESGLGRRKGRERQDKHEDREEDSFFMISKHRVQRIYLYEYFRLSR